METRYKEIRHHLTVDPENTDLISATELYALYKHSLVYPKKEPGMVESTLSGSSLEPRFALGSPVIRKIVARLIIKKVEKHGIEQVVFPGIGGLMTALAWAESGAKIKIAHVRVEKEGSHKRLKTKIEGFLDKRLPVWISDDVLTSGNGFKKTMEVLISSGYTVAGFCPLMAHTEGAGLRACQCISMSSSSSGFQISPVISLIPCSKKDRVLTKFETVNSVLFP
jgi:orotate phosphoribosyltransferase